MVQATPLASKPCFSGTMTGVAAVLARMIPFRVLTLLLSFQLLQPEAHAQSGERTRLALTMKELAAAETDALRDSINERVKLQLRALLDADESFGRSYDSIPMSRVDAPDNAFRLFTWNVPREDGTHRYEGFLLVNNGKEQSLYELRDMTSSIPSPEVPELGPDRWYGALYYQVVPVKKAGRTYYTLLGWKGYSKVETRKVIEVLSFRNGRPRFGAPLFGGGRRRTMRKVYGFSFQSSMTLRYDPIMKGILLDHLSPSRKDMEGQWAYYGPDMTHDAFFWYKGGWWYEPDIDARDPSPGTKRFNPPVRKSLEEGE